ncbi:hypothetical protein B0J11DRAFT_516649 [Dendryphion nanum]|uniref:Uncharacterized protein n=1 Tax=Dendryphion nanum TaxID=256645 RepID=A0A9P9EJJ4_9PLEO|nr:hypothetical protein B0J11DRAFT_516649 [Dendryphion nanum]
MPGMLARSRSLRILRGGHKETHQQDNARPAPPPTFPQVSMDRFKANTPVTRRTDLHLETPDTLERPKTSGGPADRGKLFHKKTFPVLDHDSQNPLSSPSQSTTTLIYSAEFHESTEGFIGIALGSPTMAPNWSTTQSTDFVPNTTHRTVTHISSNTPSLLAKEEPVSKPKLSRWRSIFGKKPQPPPQEQKPSFYQLAQSVVPTRADSHHDNESLDSRTAPQYEDAKEIESTSPPAFKPEIRQSRKLPKGYAQPTTETRPRALTHGTVMAAGNRNTTLLRSASSANTPTTALYSDSPTVPQLVVSGEMNQYSSSKASPSNLPRIDRPGMDTPLLDVDIPTIKMERYSVMFGNLLQSGAGSTSAGNRSSSLLVRRQGNSERLKALNALTVKSNEDNSHLGVVKPQRRATSPTFAPKSPSVSLSLFPQPTNRAPSPRTTSTSTNRTRVVQRSKTLPAPSPSTQSFAPQVPSSQDARKVPEKPKGKPEQSKVEQPKLEQPKAETPKPENAKPAVAQEIEAMKEYMVDLNQKSQLLSPSTLSSKSFTSGPDEMSITKSPASGDPWKARQDEPEWEVVSKPTRRPSHRELKEALSSHPTNMVMEPPPHHQPSSAPLERSMSMATNSKPSSPQLSLQSPVPRSADRLAVSPMPRAQGSLKGRKQTSGLTVGIARSVSVSRASPRNAEMLKPVLIRRGTDSPEKLVDRRALTPTLVELKDRRSQRVQLVDA